MTDMTTARTENTQDWHKARDDRQLRRVGTTTRDLIAALEEKLAEALSNCEKRSAKTLTEEQQEEQEELFTEPERQDLRKGNCNPRGFHDDARNFLENMIAAYATRPPGTECRDPIDTTVWPTWKEYLAWHKESERIVGGGILDAYVERIEGTRDANRGGKPRVDLVFYNKAHKTIRIHPGKTPSRDAAILEIRTRTTNTGSSGDQPSFRHAGQAYSQPPPVLTVDDAQEMPQVDCIGRGAMLQKLDEMSMQKNNLPFELTAMPAEVCPWRQWLANLGYHRDDPVASEPRTIGH